MVASIDRYGISAQVPTGWSVSITRRAAGSASRARSASAQLAPAVGSDADRPRPVLHASNRPLPSDVADFGGSVVDRLGVQDVFIALLEYGVEVADQGLFARRGVPRLAPSQFAGNRMARYVPGLSASQHFFSDGGRAFCLYTVIGSHARRMALVPVAARIVDTLRITSARTMMSLGGLP